MAEDQEKKDEGKLEFTPEGEALGYIGLDQAQVRAMQVATQSPGDYGAAYAGTAMAFDVVDARETEDHYVIVLSVRPQGDFAGRLGQEQFFIEKEGTVAHRQVLALPRPGRRVPIIPIAIGLVVVAAISVGAVFAVAGRDGGGEDTGKAAVLPTDTPVPATIPPMQLPNAGSTPIQSRVPITAEDVRRIREEDGGSTPVPSRIPITAEDVRRIREEAGGSTPTPTRVPITAEDVRRIREEAGGSTPIPSRVPITAEDVRRIREEAGGSTPIPTRVPITAEDVRRIREELRLEEFSTDLINIQTAVDSYFTTADNPRYLGQRQWPIMGASSRGTLMEWGDTSTGSELPATLLNPQRGTRGGVPQWKGDADFVREATEEGLIGADSTAYGGWRVTRLDFQDTDYAVDSRDFFIDFDLLVAAGILRTPPKSASPDNRGGSGDGYFSWYVSDSGSVGALYYTFPERGVVP